MFTIIQLILNQTACHLIQNQLVNRRYNQISFNLTRKKSPFFCVENGGTIFGNQNKNDFE